MLLKQTKRKGFRLALLIWNSGNYYLVKQMIRKFIWYLITKNY